MSTRRKRNHHRHHATALTPTQLSEFAWYLHKNPVWGSLHIVMEDFNLEDEHVEFCIQMAHEREDRLGEKLGRILLRLKPEDRQKVALLAAEVVARVDGNEFDWID